MTRPDDERLAIPPGLTAAVRAWTRRRRTVVAAARGAWALAAAAACVAAAMALDLADDPQPWLRIGIAAGAAACGITGLVAAMHACLVRRDPQREARALETALGLVGEPISGAIALAAAPPPGTSRWMAERALALAAVTLDTSNPRRAVGWRPARPALLAAAGLLAVLATVSALEPAARHAAVRALLPWRELPAPGAELLVAEPGDLWLAPGGTLAIGVTSPAAALVADLAWPDGRSEQRPLAREGDRHRLTIAPVHRDLRWRVRGPGLASTWHNARVVEAPRVAAVSLSITSPTYAGLPIERVPGGEALALTGSDIGIDVVLDGAVAAAAAIIAGDEEVPLPLARSPYGGQFGSARLRLTADLEWRLRLVVAAGGGGVVVEPPQRWRLRTIADRPPTVEARAIATLVAPNHAVRITVAGADDVGLSALWLETGGAAAPMRLSLPVPEGARRAEAAAVVVPLDLGAAAGDRIELTPVARDRAGTETRGESLAVLVASPAHADRQALAARLEALVTVAYEAAAAAAETERAWRSAARTWRAEDPGAQAGGLRAAEARAAALVIAAQAVADGALAAAVLAGAPGNLEAIAGRAIAVTEAAASLAKRSAEAETGAAAAVTTAVESASTLTHAAAGVAASTALAAGAAAASAALADADAARDTLAVAIAVLAAESAWNRPSWRQGLAGRFWAGAEPGTGAPAHVAAEVPAVADRDLPQLGRERWCARWTGEIHLPRQGRWTFRATADDGVRVRLGDTSLLPPEAWRDQAATDYTGATEQPAGWHPISIDYYQGGGGSRLHLVVGDGETLEPLSLARLRHRAPPDAATRRAMAALPAGAAAAAVERARVAGPQLPEAADRLRRALDLAGRAGHRLRPAAEAADRAAEALDPLRRPLDWSEPSELAAAALAADSASQAMAAAVQILRDLCRAEGRDATRDALTTRLREAASDPRGAAGQALADELAGERQRLAALAGEALASAPHRAAALAAAWVIDDLAAALRGDDGFAIRAAAAAGIPALLLAARHQRSAAAGPDQILAAIAPGWPPGLLRPARDRLRAAAGELRSDNDPIRAARAAAEAALAVELEDVRPGLPPGDDLPAAIALLRDLVLFPYPDGLSEAADLLERAESGLADARPDRDALASAVQMRREAATTALRHSAEALAQAADGFAAEGLADLATRSASLADLALAVARSPDRVIAASVAETMALTVATPAAEALADGRIAPGGAAAQAGRLAAQVVADATELAAATALPDPAPLPDDQEWTRPPSPTAVGTAAAAVDFPEEHRAAIRAYLRRLGGGR